MDKSQHIARAISAAAVIENPDLRGLPGTIALTQLKRAIVKIGTLPPEISHLTPSRLEELRQANLIASADLALQKLRDPSRDPKNRMEQVHHLEHYIEKADCGWQAVGLSQREFIALQFSLHCEFIQDVSGNEHELRHYEDKAYQFVNRIGREDRIPEEHYEEYQEKLRSIVLAKQESLRNADYNLAEEGFRSMQTVPMSSKEILDLTQSIRQSLRKSQKDSPQIRAMYDELEEREEAATKLNFRERYDQVIVGETGFDAIDNIDKIEQEMGYARLTWPDIDLDEADVEKAKTTLAYQGLEEKFLKGKALVDEGKIGKAYAEISFADYMLHRHDYALIGRDTSGMAEFFHQVIKLKLNEDFQKALDPSYSGRAAVHDIEKIESQLRSKKIDWQALDPSKDQNIFRENLASIYLRAADEEAAEYLGGKHPGTLHAIGWYLDKAGKNWDVLEKAEEVRKTADANKHPFPALNA